MGSTSYLTRGKTAGRGTYGAYRPTKSASSIGSDKEVNGKLKRPKPSRRTGKLSDFALKRTPDYTELAYKEAVSKLRYFLSGNLAPGYRSYGGSASIKNLDESDAEDKKYPVPATLSYGIKPRLTAKYSQLYADSLRNYNQYSGANNDTASKASSRGGGAEPSATSPEVVHFIQKQEEYIEQLERESQYCRDELNNLLGKVKEVISENEHLHEAQKNKLISRMFDSYGGSETDDLDDLGDSTGLDSDNKASPSKVRKVPRAGRSTRLEGPNIVFESRIAELEAQLMQAKIDQKKVQEENNENRRKLAEGLVDSSCLDGFKRQIDNLQRDKASLEAQISKLKLSLEQRDASDSELGSRLKRGSDVIEQQLREERNSLEAEVRRLKEDLSSQRGKVRELTGEGARRAIQERSAAEQRYTTHLDEMSNELAAQYDNVSKLQLDLERQRRDEHDLKRELAMKTAAIDELKMELKSKTASIQADLSQVHAEKSSLDEELASARLAIERHQRQAKHETNRLNSEIQSLRQRLDRADADLVHSRRENLRLSEEIAKLEKDLKLGNLTPASPVKSNKDKELANMLDTMEKKHAHTVAELEAMIQSQNSLMDKLTGECRLLTDKLDHASRRHKEEMADLHRQVEGISQSFQQPTASFSIPTANMYQAPATSTANFPDNSRTQTPPRNEYSRTDPSRDAQIRRQPTDTSDGDHRDGQTRRLSKQPSRDSFRMEKPPSDDKNYLNNDIQIPPDKFEEKTDETTEKELHRVKDEPKYVPEAALNTASPPQAVAQDQAYTAEPQYAEEKAYPQQSEYQPQYPTESETYSQEAAYTGEQAYSTQPVNYDESQYNQGYATEYPEGQYENPAQYPTQEYAEGQGYATEQGYQQQPYDYAADPNYQVAADPNYQATVDPNYASDANYQGVDPTYTATNQNVDPTYQSVNPTYTATNPTVDPAYQGVNPTYSATNPNVDPTYQGVNPSYAVPDPNVEKVGPPATNSPNHRNPS